jgi:carboxymethylenebutenolidase
METMNGVEIYRAEPQGKPVGALILIHEIWGLVDHIKVVADRYATEGFLVIAPDLLSIQGITPLVGQELIGWMTEPDEEKRLAQQTALREGTAPARAPGYAEVALDMLRRVVDGLEDEGYSRIAVLGFCFGGTYSYALAAEDSRICAAVPFYGTAPSDEKIPHISCPVLAFYGEIDPPIMADFPRVAPAMKKAGVDFEYVIYPDVQHAFFNDENKLRYNQAAAGDAWAKSIAFLHAAMN